MNKKSFVVTASVLVIVVFGFVYLLTSFFSSSSSDEKVTNENKKEVLADLYSDVSVSKEKAIKGQIDLNPADVADELPDISKFSVPVDKTTDSYVEIFSSTEKSGNGSDGWLNEVATDFNNAGITVNGKKVSVKIRSIASGTATDYIRSGKYVPDAFAPSNELWGEMVKDGGVKTTLVSKRLIGNVPGMVISKTKYDQVKKKYGKVDVKTVTEAMANNEFAMGYTDPFASSTGINFLVTALHSFDQKSLLSDAAVKGFEEFQNNVPFTASTTLQMRDAAKSGALDGFVLEYQTFVNSPDLKDRYVFTPFGVRHDSPLYALGKVSDEKQQIIQKFADFSQQAKYQDDAKKDGFNYLDEYKPTINTVDGATLTAAQKLWKEKKNGSKPIAAVFVTDVSGSMNGEPLKQLKESLLKGQKYLGRDNSIGLVSYSDDVTINLPIGKYTINQQSKFVGAIESLQASGSTATYDGVIVAMNMLEKEKKKNPNIRPLIFVLSDGETNQGHDLNEVKGVIGAYKIPVYTIGYNADLKELQKVSKINEAASINADTDDVVYKIRNLFNVQM